MDHKRHGWLGAAAITSALAAMGGLGACAGEEVSPTGTVPEASAEVAQAVTTCVTIKRLGPAPGGVEDANLISDPTDPTKASTNYGGIQQMNTGFVGSDFRQIVMRFDMSAVPPGQIVRSAALTFRMIQSPGKGALDIHRGMMPWSEGSVTYNSFAGNFDPAPLLSVGTLGVPNNSNLTVDITSLAEGWYTGAMANGGILINHPAAGRTVIGSSEAPTPAPRPLLTVCYDPDPCFGIACAPIECQVAGGCEPTSGTCTYAPAADGTACSVGTCQAGSCVNAGGGGACANGWAYNGGCWFSAPALGMNCDQVCAPYGGFDTVHSQHTTNTVGFHFYPGKANGVSDWSSIECSSTDNNTNWPANGAAPDPTFSHPACYVSCACNDAVAPTCSDGIQNQAESDIDCGGPCADCTPGYMCLMASDCDSGVCTGGICQAPTCSDGVQNGNESGIDTGGSCVVAACSGWQWNNGCWYTAPALGMTCNQVCSSHGGFDTVHSQHTTNTVGFHFWPGKSNGVSDWSTIECSSTDNNTNWPANGGAPDGNFSHAACYVNCACAN